MPGVQSLPIWVVPTITIASLALGFVGTMEYHSRPNGLWDRYYRYQVEHQPRALPTSKNNFREQIKSSIREFTEPAESTFDHGYYLENPAKLSEEAMASLKRVNNLILEYEI